MIIISQIIAVIEYTLSYLFNYHYETIVYKITMTIILR